MDFLNATTRYMDTLDWIQGYAWFAFFVRRWQPSNCVLQKKLIPRPTEERERVILQQVYGRLKQFLISNLFHHSDFLDGEGNLNPLSNLYFASRSSGSALSPSFSNHLQCFCLAYSLYFSQTFLQSMKEDFHFLWKTYFERYRISTRGFVGDHH